MIFIQIPGTYTDERRYILAVMFNEFLGLDIQVQVSDRQDVRITVDSVRELVVADGLFAVPSNQWLQHASLPKRPLKTWNLATTRLTAITVNPQIPLIYGDDPSTSNFFRLSEERIHLGLDIFGSAFFMLTCYEEMVKGDRDQHDRFPAKSSLAYQERFLERPIVNEYLEILWWCLKYLWSGLERKSRQFRVCLTHDVDNPFELTPFQMKRWLRRLGGHLVLRRDVGLASSLAVNGCFAALGLPHQDGLDTFDWVMDQSESIRVKSAFYFICGGNSQFDPCYDVNSLAIRKLIRQILSRGHEVGLHPSYDTYIRLDKLKIEAYTLQCILSEEGAFTGEIGGRQHFLRWKAPDTWQYWEDSGLAYDSSLGYSEHVGFRCGTCYEYPVFNLKTGQGLKLRERPLTIMECSMLRSSSMGLSNDKAWLEVKKLIDVCRVFDGDFTLLWHNSELVTGKSRTLYKRVITHLENSFNIHSQ
ncbi:MAG: polysaccharide deacetylase family protein [Coleofasciculus sp. G3-WIS-01]|uniref:polysaccharide deacetylase family protein n=1 Tax=Coleofasciculus sp. G3-WIS-01 TaxID=3069528 RepID=UPI0032FA2291